jgi:hypothetical protein
VPIGDWQFWVVTALAVLALAYLLREVLPARLSLWKRRPGGRKATLTIKGKAPVPHRKGEGSRAGG